MEKYYLLTTDMEVVYLGEFPNDGNELDEKVVSVLKEKGTEDLAVMDQAEFDKMKASVKMPTLESTPEPVVGGDEVFVVTMQSITMYTADVTARTRDEAEEIARGMDGCEFTEVEFSGDWSVYDVHRKSKTEAAN